MSSLYIFAEIISTLCLMFFGFHLLQSSVQRSVGASVKKHLRYCTQGSILAFISGFFASFLTQSSLAVSLLLDSLSEYASLPLSASTAIILGASLGTSVLAGLLHFSTPWITVIVFTAGYVLRYQCTTQHHQNIGTFCLGLGLIFLAINALGNQEQLLGNSTTLPHAVILVSEDAFFALIFASAIAFLFQSALATVLLISSIVVHLPNSEVAIWFTIGANLGNLIQLTLMWSKGTRSGKDIQLSCAVNFSRLLITLPMFFFVDTINKVFTENILDPSNRVLLMHVAYNVVVSVVSLIFLPLICKIIQKLISPSQPTPQHLSTPRPIDSPVFCISNAAMETLYMGEIVVHLLKCIMDSMINNDERKLFEVAHQSDKINKLYVSICEYLTHLKLNELTLQESERISEILIFSQNLKHASDALDKSLRDLARQKHKYDLPFSEEGKIEMDEIYHIVYSNIIAIFELFISRNRSAATNIVRQDEKLHLLIQQACEKYYKRLQFTTYASTADKSSLHIDVIRDLKIINNHITSIAYDVLRKFGDLYVSQIKPH